MNNRTIKPNIYADVDKQVNRTKRFIRETIKNHPATTAVKIHMEFTRYFVDENLNKDRKLINHYEEKMLKYGWKVEKWDIYQWTNANDKLGGRTYVHLKYLN